MPFVSVTRLRVRSLRFLPAFFVQAIRTRRQVSAATGFQAGALLPDRRMTFWTLTLWDDAAAMRAYINAGAHKAVMPKLMHWCDEASIVHWDQSALTMPTWTEADARMRREGRASKLRNPSADHWAMNFAPPRAGDGSRITPSG